MVTSDGQLLPINRPRRSSRSLRTTFGGDGRVNFALPDLRPHADVGSGRTLGERGGEQRERILDGPAVHKMNRRSDGSVTLD
jgi:microcystin-dependent protein